MKERKIHLQAFFTVIPEYDAAVYAIVLFSKVIIYISAILQKVAVYTIVNTSFLKLENTFATCFSSLKLQLTYSNVCRLPLSHTMKIPPSANMKITL